MANEERKLTFPAGTDINLMLRFLMGDDSVKLEKHEIFTHIDDDNKCSRAFNVTLLQRYIDSRPRDFEIFNIVVDKRVYEQCKTLRGYEQPRLDRLTRDVILHKPVIFIELDGSYVMIDGTHRMIKAYELKMRVVPGYVVPESVWTHFLVPVEKGLTPEELLKRKSGIE